MIKRRILPALLCVLLVFGMLPSVAVQAQELPGGSSMEGTEPEEQQPFLPGTESAGPEETAAPEETVVPEETLPPEVTSLPEESTQPEAVSTNGGFTVDYVVASQWEHGYTASVKITNTGDKAIQNWCLAFLSADEIKSVWNATFTSENGCYQIKNAGWNADIQPGGSVSFGFTASCGETADTPHTFWMLGKEETLPGEACRVSFRITSLWEKGYTGELCLENLTDQPLEGWQLSFDLPDEIDSLWEAELSAHEDGRYLLKHKDYNTTIPAQGNVTIGFTVHGTDFTASPEHFEVRRMIVNEIPEDAYDEEIGIAYIQETEPEAVRLAEDGVKYTKNQLNLVGTQGCDFETMSGLGEAYSFRIVGYIELTNDFQVEFLQEKTYEELIAIKEELAREESVEEANLNTVLDNGEDFTPNDTAWAGKWGSEPEGDNWGMEAIHAPKAWNYRNEMVKVRIGLIDNMFDTRHEDLNFKAVFNNREVIDSDHGTHVAGTMAAAFNNKKGVAGLCVKHDLYAFALKGTKYGTVGSGLYSSVMKYKLGFALLIGRNVKVINFSLNDGKEQCFAASQGNEAAKKYIKTNAGIMGAYLNRLLNKGFDFVICSSAGNVNNRFYVPSKSVYGWEEVETGTGASRSGSNAYYSDAQYNSFLNYITIPQVKDRIIVTGAYGENYADVEYSCVGGRVDVVAPGNGIQSTAAGNTYKVDKGTSMASPHTAGLAALIYSINPALSGKQVKDIIKDKTNPQLITYKTPRMDTKYSYRFTYKSIDAGKAVEEARRVSGITPPVNDPMGFVLGTMIYEDYRVIPGVKITAYKYDSSEGMVGIGTPTNYHGVVTTDQNGEYDFELEPGIYQFQIYKEGYIPLKMSHIMVEPESTNYINKCMFLDTIKKPSEAAGTIRDALTGEPVSGVTVRFREGWNTRTGTYKETKTNTAGSYTLSLEKGYYTAELSKAGYITGYLNVLAIPGPDVMGQNGVITPKLADNEYRIVLTWGSTPRDLDSHLTGPAEKGRFHIFYSNKSYSYAGDVIAKLDYDKVNSYGPETVTVTVKEDRKGVYRYSVHDYSNWRNEKSSALSLSGASVKVYKGNALVKTYDVPINQKGTLWTVFELEDGNIKTLNKMTYESDEGNIK